jgi:hypothetical protein
MNRDAEAVEKVLRDGVLAYLEEHPGAMDTLEGIARSWITPRNIRVDLDALARVLDRLTERGVLEVVGTHSSRRYRQRTTAR